MCNFLPIPFPTCFTYDLLLTLLLRVLLTDLYNAHIRGMIRHTALGSPARMEDYTVGEIRGHHVYSRVAASP